MPDSHVYLDGKKFMWDAITYESKASAEEAKKKYEADNFEARLVTEGDQTFVYSRRVVTEVVVEGEPPAA